MAPLVERLKREYQGKVEFRRYDVTSDPTGQKIADAVGSEYVPTFLFFDKTGKQVDMFVGGMTEAQLKTKLDSLK